MVAGVGEGVEVRHTGALYNGPVISSNNPKVIAMRGRLILLSVLLGSGPDRTFI
jgi:hypothetical protein